MLFLVVLVIALGWAGWFWAWGRDRYTAGTSMGLPPSPFNAPPASSLGPPRNAVSARRRRREVLGTVSAGVLVSFLLSLAWTPMWFLTLSLFAFLCWYALAVYRLENGTETSTVRSLQNRFGPVLDEDASRPAIPPSQRLRQSA